MIPSPTAPVAAARSFWALRDLPTALWLAALVLVTAIHPWLATPRWLLIHLFFLGALTHAVLVWSQHFAAALLRRPTDRDRQSSRLILANGGAVLVIVGVEAGWWVVVLGGAVCVAAAVVWHAWEFVAGLRQALGNRFAATLRYYIVAASLFLVGIVLGTLLARAPQGEWHSRLLVAHAAVNVLGWIGLTILGTLDDGLGRGIDKLAVKSTLDGFASIAFGASFGYGVLAAAVSVLVVQGLLTVMGVALGAIMTAAQIAALTATGGLILVGIGLRLLRIRDLPVGDLLPALLVAPLLTTLVAALR